MKIENGYYIWNKSDPSDWIGKWFKSHEFSCLCEHDDCIEQKVSLDLINRLEWLREASKSPLFITSGFRCAKHQAEIKESGKSTVVATHSQHELGNAADVKSSALIIPELLKLAELKFYSIGIASNFIHLDTRPKKADGSVRRWTY